MIQKMIQRIQKYSFRSIIFILFVVGLFYIYESKAQENEETIKEQSYILEARKQSPNLSWVKDENLVLLELNDAFVDILLTPNGLSREDYIGHTDFEVWDSVSASEYQKFDRKAMDCKCPIVQIIKAPHVGDTIIFTAIKYPVYFSNGTIGVGGDSKVELLKDGKVVPYLQYKP